MKNWWLLPLGLLFGLWLSERERRLIIEHRRSRKPEEISPLFKEHQVQERRLYHLGGNKIASYIHDLTGELIQPDLTELEAKRVHDEISWLMRDAIGYEADHEEYQKKQQDKWIEATEDTDDE